MKFLQGLPAQLFQVTSGFEFPRSKFGHVQPGRRGTIMLKGCPQDALEIKFIWQNPTRRIVPPIIRTDVPRIGRRENFIPLVKWNTRGNEIAKFEACERTRWTECIRGSEGDYVRWKGGSSKGGRWMDRPTDPAWQETSSRGSRVCTHRERNTKWSGKHRQCFLLSFPFFFFPLPSSCSSPRYFLQFSSNRTLRVMSRGLLNTSRLRSVRPFLSPLEKKSKRWEEWREGWRENWWLLLLEYKYEYTRECIISRKRSRTDVNVTAPHLSRSKIDSPENGARERNCSPVLERNSKEIVRPTVFLLENGTARKLEECSLRSKFAWKKKEEKKNTNEERRTPVLRVRSEKRKLVVVRAWNADSVPATIRNTDAQWVIAIAGQWYVRRRRKHRIRHIASVNTVFIDGTRGHVATPS